MVDTESIKDELRQLLELLSQRASGMPPRHFQTMSLTQICDRIGMLVLSLPKGELICLP